MVKGIYEAARGLDTRMRNLETVANNLANINTTGYKREVPFSEILNQAGNIQIQQVTDYKQGNLVQTSNPLDLAISGNGFFVVQTNSGQELTRGGNFKISDAGFLTDADGNLVMGQRGAINLLNYNMDKNQKLTVASDGELKIGNNVIDNLLIAQPVDPQQAARTAGVNFDAGNGGFKIASQDNYDIKQGYLEESNVNPIQEMEEMIQLNTEYGSAQKMISFLDQSLDQANQIGKV